MMLYKYVTFETGRKVLEGNSTCFSLCERFNDPFDRPRYPRAPGSNILTDLFGSNHAWGKELVWRKSTGILSLTRTPANPLMWAHYAQSHTGLVIGIDAIKAGFTAQESNLIPAQFGSMIYVSKRPSEEFVSQAKTVLEVGATHHFPIDHYEKLQRIFLHKSALWAYEEEVRVVKCLGGLSETGGASPSGSFEIVSSGRDKLHLYELPKGAIAEVYFGLYSDHGKSDALYHRAKKRDADVKFFDAVLDESAMSVKSTVYTTQAEAASP